MNRNEMLSRLSEPNSVWDMLVIGGGATGLGIAWNAAASDYRVAVLEAHDFAQGTSSRSTKLIHGGVRYLRQGQIGMVRSSLHEREFLLQSASPLVWPLDLVIPSYAFGSRWYYYAGLKLYDYLAGKRNMDPTRLLSAPQVQQLLPTLKSSGLHGGVAFCDGQFDDARLAVAVAQSVVEGGQSAVLNYAPVLSIDTEKQTGHRVVRFRDAISRLEQEVRACVVVNATGVFAEQVVQLEHENDTATSDASDSSAIRIAPSRGTHVVLPESFLPGGTALMIPNTDDGRVLFAIPWLEHTLLGTTDIATDKVELEPRAQDDEVDYLLEHLSRYLTTAPKRSDVLSVFSGLRPLIGKSGSSSTSKLSRDHEIVVSKSGLISIIGGKWTTFRKMGRDVMELAVQVGKLQRRTFQTPSLSAQLMLEVEHEPADAYRIDPRLPISRSDIRRAVQDEMAEKLEDVLSRRTRCLLLNASASLDVAPAVASLMREANGHDASWAEGQLADFRSLARIYQP